MDVISEPFTYEHARRHGLTANDLVERCRAGELVRPHRGVYLPAHLVDDLDARVVAVGLLLPRGAAVARESAAWMLGLDVRPPERWRSAPKLECLVPLDGIRPRHPGVNAFISALPPDDIVVINGIACTTATRTGLDLARWRPRFIGLGAVDALAHAGLTTVTELAEAAGRLAGHRFIRRAREVIDLCEPATESVPESWCRLRLIEAGLPRPAVQVSLRDADGREVYRLDMGILEALVGIEYDGAEHHLRTVADRERDEARRKDIRRRWRWRVLPATAADILGRSPQLEGAVMELLGISIDFRRQDWGLQA
ncbi:type IV toxin-antitoxin system AbiEi family antitoxin domain-containing protein [Georgenia satyanarayanai]|nr:type IV toxin-antitoxin system AbiEi family antitoxin domain-containing protein [Georgenia satyanarayanai]